MPRPKSSEDPQKKTECMRHLCLEQTTDESMIEEITRTNDEKQLRGLLLKLRLKKRTMWLGLW